MLFDFSFISSKLDTVEIVRVLAENDLICFLERRKIEFVVHIYNGAGTIFLNNFFLSWGIVIWAGTHITHRVIKQHTLERKVCRTKDFPSKTELTPT